MLSKLINIKGPYPGFFPRSMIHDKFDSYSPQTTQLLKMQQRIHIQECHLNKGSSF